MAEAVGVGLLGLVGRPEFSIKLSVAVHRAANAKSNPSSWFM